MAALVLLPPRARELREARMCLAKLPSAQVVVDSKDIIAKATNAPEFFQIAGADHVFSDDALPAMVAKVVEWVKAQAG